MYVELSFVRLLLGHAASLVDVDLRQNHATNSVMERHATYSRMERDVHQQECQEYDDYALHRSHEDDQSNSAGAYSTGSGLQQQQQEWWNQTPLPDVQMQEPDWWNQTHVPSHHFEEQERSG